MLKIKHNNSIYKSKNTFEKLEKNSNFSCRYLAPKSNIKKNESVILIHGLFGSNVYMRGLATYLSKLGYGIYLYDYPSTKHYIDKHGLSLYEFIQSLLDSTDHNHKFNIITHSLGGIIAKEALAKCSKTQLNRFSKMIMLTPPNKGSFLANLLATYLPFLSRWVKPLPQLSNDPKAYVHTIATPNIKIGIVAAKFDIKTPPPTTQLDNQSDFVLVPSTHTFMVFSDKTKRAISSFLEHGYFS